MSVTYVLTPDAVRTRARAVAASGAAVAVAPAWLVVVLVAQLGLASRAATLGIALAIGALGALRAIVEQGRARRRLGAFSVLAEDDELLVTTLRAKTRVPKAGIARVAEVDGAYGGLRVELVLGSDPGRFDVPRGGERFADLREWFAKCVPIERAARRGPLARVLLVASVVLAVFFVPFVVADARGSRTAIALVLIAAWVAVRAVSSRA